ncbi:ABC transporter permease [Streptomyces sp. CB01881]|uniref:ABC transporter permease n=1 Tax=Streptomyces sp. CB01881 TaxID=2078691 RepID=UPI000CDCBB9C|nr:ABC transporter permease [Streptomyces sp. CB01881]AUY50147.1 ABC transporter permease [Streptomyces sp. CB01881]TYC73540.1 ABC transporter permease [Streptomyces sp. CB01881]
MSQVEATGVVTSRAAGRRPQTAAGFLALFRSELLLTFRRVRTVVLLGILAVLPVLIGVVVKIETDGPSRGEGPAFIAQVTQNGLFLVFTALAVSLPVFLPMAVGVVAGDSVAGESAGGTLRYLLVAPAGRTRLLAAKFTAGLAFCLAATLTVALAALATGAALFPMGEVTLVSGETIGVGPALLRAVLVAVVVAASLSGLVAIGLFISTLTGSGIAAMAATVGLVITVQILDSFPQLHAVQPFLFAHHWLSFGDLLREPIYWDDVLKNLGLQGAYVAVFGSAAWSRFTSRDITA